MKRAAFALMSVAVPLLLLGAADEPDEPLVTVRAVDAETGAPVATYRALPGVPYDGKTDEGAVAVWQPHLLGESTDGGFEWPRARSYEAFRFRVEADGYRPERTAWIKRTDAPRSIEVRLRRDAGIRGRVLKPDGKPAAGATLAIALPNRTVRLQGRTVSGADDPPQNDPRDRWRQPLSVKADAEGRFSLPAENDPAALLAVVHESGYFQQPWTEFAGTAEKDVTLDKWGSIAGRVLLAKPGAAEAVELIVSRDHLYPDMLSTFRSVKSDGEGRFWFDDVPPGRVQLSRPVPDDRGELTQYRFPVIHLEIVPGENEVALGRAGKTVVGKLVNLSSYESVTLRVHPWAPHIGFPGDDEQWRGWSALRNSPLGNVVFRDKVPVEADGRFRIEGLPPESYQLHVEVPGAKEYAGGTSFRVEPRSKDQVGEQDLGEIRAAAAKK